MTKKIDAKKKETEKPRVIDLRPKPGKAYKDQTLEELIEYANKLIPTEYYIMKDEFGLSLYARHDQIVENEISKRRRVETMQEGTKEKMKTYLKGLCDSYNLVLSSFRIKQYQANVMTGDINKEQTPIRTFLEKGKSVAHAKMLSGDFDPTNKPN